MNGESCGYTEEQVLAYVAGDLKDAEELAVAEHLGECRGCCEQAAEFVALDAAGSACCAEDVVRWHRFEIPFGTMRVAATERGLVRITWREISDAEFDREMQGRFPDVLIVRDPDALAGVEAQLREYFAGERSRFELPVDLSALTEFERSVLSEALRIPAGVVIPYSELAERIGKPRAARAVGNALGANPIPIVVPCHRIIRRDGSLGGYGGGVEYKAALLGIEGRDDLARAS